MFAVPFRPRAKSGPEAATDDVAGDGTSCCRMLGSSQSVVETRAKKASGCKCRRRRDSAPRVRCRFRRQSGRQTTCSSAGVCHVQLRQGRGRQRRDTAGTTRARAKAAYARLDTYLRQVTQDSISQHLEVALGLYKTWNKRAADEPHQPRHRQQATPEEKRDKERDKVRVSETAHVSVRLCSLNRDCTSKTPGLGTIPVLLHESPHVRQCFNKNTILFLPSIF